MEDCILCQILNGRLPSKKIYEDKDAIAVLDLNGATLGHTFIIPREHYTIMEQVPNKIISHLFNLSNKISKAIFDTLNVGGTNLFVSNGISAGQMVPHFMINVIPRRENDNINLQWKPKQATEEEMSKIQSQLKDAIFYAPEDTKKAKKSEPIKEVTKYSGEHNHLMKQIRRIP